MSSSDRLLLILHIGFAIFTLGPLTAATMATPRYIRRRNVAVVRYLNRTTQIYGLGTLGIFLFGMFLGKGRLGEVWLSVSMTLMVVALVLLFLVDRDQRKAAHALEVAAAEETSAEVVPAAPAEETAEKATGKTAADPAAAEAPASRAAAPRTDIAQVERGRIAAISGVIALIWLVILVLMVWNG
ncbi:hypothetical protein [Actinomadura hibisca]|uniref:hypothetical protein n=1 Tax=Actinomadura hibisca TaxID=68565 RepID=UPI00082D3793|nr:hypothetical protein [Actinomadura hibisca]